MGSESAGQSTVGRRATFLFLTFPDRYVDGVVDGLIHPEWRTACFSRTCTNASSWAVYGHNHTGAALIFRPTIENGQLSFRSSASTGSVASSGERHRKCGALSEVRFCLSGTQIARPRSISFSRSAGSRGQRLNERGTTVATVPQPGHRCVDQGRRSLARSVLGVVQAGRDHESWKIGSTRRSTAFLGRRLGHPYGDRGRARGVRVLRAHWMIFGLRTEEKHKIEVMRLIEADCARTGRKDFAFHQMAYQGSKGCLVRL